MNPSRWSALGGLVMVAMLLGNVGTASAVLVNGITFPQETDLVLSGSGITLKILAGSVASTLDINASDFTVEVATGGTFNVRYPGPNPGTMTNNGGLNACRKSDDNNDIVVTGPMTVTFTPSATPVCVTSGGSRVTPSTIVSSPNGGEAWSAGTAQSVYWSANGSSVTGVRLSYSTDGGSTWSLIVDNLSSSGFYSWTVPNTATTQAKIKVDLLGGGSVLASDVSDSVFTIVGQTTGGGGGSVTPTTPVVTTPATVAATITVVTPTKLDDIILAEAVAPRIDPFVAGRLFVPASVAGNNPTINVDKGLVELTLDPLAKCESGTLIKGSGPSVYFCGRDGRRYVFVSQSAYKSWYPDFSSVKTISDADLASIMLGGNVTYKPGTRMIKIQSDPKVYAVARGGTLRWVQTEAIARALYGDKWSMLVDDVADAFFVNYRLGEPLTE